LQGDCGYGESVADYDLQIVSRGATPAYLCPGFFIQVSAQVGAQEILIFGGRLGADFE
jgi:hypothetical protein